jgi:tetratricopeptide (TPR) repeat protein
MISALLLLALAGGAPPVAAEPSVPEAVPAEAAGARGDAYFHLMKARIAASRGRLSEALSEIRAATALVPQSAGLRAESASLLLSLGRGAEAERLARQAIEIDPDATAAIRVLGDLAARRALGTDTDEGSRGEAIRHYEKLSRSPDVEDDVFPILARLRLMAGDADGAVAAARALASRRPGDASAARLLAQYLDRDGKKGEAAKGLAAFLAGNPDVEELIPLLGDLARESREWEAVVAATSKMIEAAPGRPAARALRGEALLRLGRGREAMADLETVRTLAPDNRLALLELASAYGDVGRLTEAAGLLRDLARDLPEHPGVRIFLGEILSRQGDLDGAVESFGAALRAVGSSEADGAEGRDGIRRRIASLWLSRSNPEEAAKALAALERPDDAASLELRARAVLNAGDSKEAQVLVRKLRDKGEAGLAAALEGEMLAGSGKFDRARAKFAEAAGLLGASIWGRAAEQCMLAGHPDEGEKWLREWARKEPERGEARFRLGAFLERQKRYDEADAELGAAIRLDPKDAVSLNYLGYSLAERGQRLDDAIGFVRRALDEDPWNAAYLDSLGWVLFRMGRFDEAREPLERAVNEFPRDATVLEHLGDLYSRIGERGRAVNIWRRALESGSSNGAALESKIKEGTADPGTGAPRSGGAADSSREDASAERPDTR